MILSSLSNFMSQLHGMMRLRFKEKERTDEKSVFEAKPAAAMWQQWLAVARG